MRPRVPKAVTQEFTRSLDAATIREARTIAQAFNQTPTQETPMTTKRTVRTRKAEPAPATPKPEPKTAAKATTTRSSSKATKKSITAKPTDRAKTHAAYTKSKLAVQRRVKLNVTVTYHGRNELLDGKPVKVTGYEGRGGVFVEFKGERYVVSPHALLKPTK